MRLQSTTGSNTGVRSETGCPVILCPKHQACFKGSFRSSFLGRHQRGVASDKHTCHSRLGTCRPPADVNSVACRASNRITATTSFTAPNKCDEDRATTSTFLFGYDAQRRAEAERELRKLTDNSTDFGVRKGVDASTPEDKESERVADKQEQRRDAEASVTQQVSCKSKGTRQPTTERHETDLPPLSCSCKRQAHHWLLKWTLRWWVAQLRLVAKRHFGGREYRRQIGASSPGI